MSREVLTDPDCVAGKHVACDGRGWDVAADRHVACPCSCHHARGADVDVQLLCIELERVGPTVHTLAQRARAIARLRRESITPSSMTGYRQRRSA